MRDEGYIKFHCDWIDGPSPEWHRVSALNDWRQLLFDAGLIGAYRDGIGYGNISVRTTSTNEFIVTGSATGVVPKLRPEHFTRVVEFDVAANYVKCRGPVEASSESLTHAAFYRASKSIQAVIHIHNAELWHRYLNILPTTSPDVAYGTPEIANEVYRLLKQDPAPKKQIVVMGGHEDGVMAYGNSLGHAASILLNCCDRMFRNASSR